MCSLSQVIRKTHRHTYTHIWFFPNDGSFMRTKVQRNGKCLDLDHSATLRYMPKNRSNLPAHTETGSVYMDRARTEDLKAHVIFG